SGCLSITHQAMSWKIYLKKGDLQYVGSSVESIAQLQYHFMKQGWNSELSALQSAPLDELTNPSSSLMENGLFAKTINWLQQDNIFNDQQKQQKLIEEICQDNLESLLWLQEGQTEWQEGVTTPAWLTQSVGDSVFLNLAEMVKFLLQRLRGWQSCSPLIESPYQRPYLLDYRDIWNPVPGGTLAPEALNKLAQLMRRGLSLRQLSLFLKQDELHVAQILSPYIDCKLIHLRDPQPPFDRVPSIIKPETPPQPKAVPVISPTHKVHKIVCIDDSPTILSEIQRFLASEQFEVTAVDDPVLASSVIFRIQPDLILLDITMPRINGYRLCSLLRSSAVFDNTPIIMATGNTGLIDKARAKLAGATDYITKPFTQRDLMSIVERYLQPA
ncbi:MAG: response regulator, partial [Thermosynechococcaceae cyanobacterium]